MFASFGLPFGYTSILIKPFCDIGVFFSNWNAASCSNKASYILVYCGNQWCVDVVLFTCIVLQRHAASPQYLSQLATKYQKQLYKEVFQNDTDGHIWTSLYRIY